MFDHRQDRTVTGASGGIGGATKALQRKVTVTVRAERLKS
jgi:hypothetical protein